MYLLFCATTIISRLGVKLARPKPRSSSPEPRQKPRTVPLGLNKTVTVEKLSLSTEI